MSASHIKAIIVSSPLILLSACATPVVHNTPSGKAEATVPVPPDVVKPILVGEMTNAGFTIFRDTPYQMAFDHPVTNVMTAVLLGSRYDATPDERVTFTFAPMGNATRIVGDISFVTNPGSAFERITPANGNVDSGDLQKALDRLQNQLASHVSDGHTLQVILTQQQGQPIAVTSVLPGGRAASAGFLAGDTIAGFNGEPVTTSDDLKAKTNAFTGTEADYTIIRHGDTIHLKVHFAG